VTSNPVSRFGRGGKCLIRRRLSGVLSGESALEGQDRERKLLRQMTAEVPGVRPAALSKETACLLDEYRLVRDAVRSGRSFECD